MTVWAVTGASGYIGGVLARRLVAAGHRVRCLARREIAIDGADVIVGDIRDPAAVARVVSDSEVLVHLAAWVHREPRSRDERRICRETNVDGTRNVIDACATAPSRPFLVFVSTASVYGEGGLEIDENAAVAPRTYYGETKAEAEQIILDAIRSGRIRGAILRPSVVFGSGAPGNLSRLARLIRRGVFPVIGGGRAQKSILPIGMLIEGIQAVAASREQTNGRIYNAACASMTMRRIGEIIAGAAGVKLRAIPVPMIVARLSAAGLGVLAPRFSRLIRVYTSSQTLSSERLRTLPAFRWSHSAESALQSFARGVDLF